MLVKFTHEKGGGFQPCLLLLVARNILRPQYLSPLTPSLHTFRLRLSSIFAGWSATREWFVKFHSSFHRKHSLSQSVNRSGSYLDVSDQLRNHHFFPNWEGCIFWGTSKKNSLRWRKTEKGIDCKNRKKRSETSILYGPYLVVPLYKE